MAWRVRRLGYRLSQIRLMQRPARVPAGRDASRLSEDGRGAASLRTADCVQPVPVRPAACGEVGPGGWWEFVADHRGYRRQLAVNVGHWIRETAWPGSLRGSGTLERSRHARGGQRRYDGR